MFMASRCPTSHTHLPNFAYLLSPHLFRHLVTISHHSETCRSLSSFLSLAIRLFLWAMLICDIFWCHQWLFCVLYLIKILCPLKWLIAVFSKTLFSMHVFNSLLQHWKLPVGYKSPSFKSPCFSFYLYFN